uniref:Large ribosomal subunit protein uL1c n=1 Tax=Polysiphonia sertularioides TaxID=945028 RepID=A0A1Z1M9S7_9FLOR|nr:ribosomal protein L1 [Polysiphonia sertularioides]ARW62571.1 ribosomal protein L1 [Polysiphonia sertularioides]
MVKHSRRFTEVLQKLDKNVLYSPDQALELLQKLSSVKFIETLEAHISLGLDPKYADQQLRATVVLPKGLGKDIRVAVISQGNNLDIAIASGADKVGSEDLIEDILNGYTNFDKLIVTPDMMLLIAKLGRVLGPRGLMPSPKSGTVTNDLKAAITQFKAGKLEYKIDRTGIVHVPIGNLSFPINDLKVNLKALQDSIEKNRPSGSRGKYWKSLYLSSTMGPGIPVDINLLKDYIIG